MSSSTKMGVWHRIYDAFGFSKGYNFVFYIITIGALMGFTLARLMFLSFSKFCSNATGGSSAAPGECFYYQGGHYKFGIQMHLGAILPAAFLVCFQFTPVIRHKLLLFHRINGYVVLILVQFSTAGALMIARRAFGGSLSTQAGIGVIAILATWSLTLAYINVKRLQIDQHRAWMIRGWAYMASIITLRIILIASASIISLTKDFYLAIPCDKLAYLVGSQDMTTKYFPDCAAFFQGQATSGAGSVLASMSGKKQQVSAALDMSFGMALWLALFIHLILAEIYLSLTRGETARLRQYSYERQLKAGFKNPGYAGITFDRISDERWVPKVEDPRIDSIGGDSEDKSSYRQDSLE